MRSHLGALAMMLAVGLLAGCSSTEGDKSGAPSVLTLTVGYTDPAANNNGQSPAGPIFLSELRERFGDQLDLVEKSNLGEGKPGGDAATIRMIANGEVDAGWVPVRALSDAGIHGFDALVAPMVITSYGAESAVVQSPVAQDFLDQFEGSGLVGLSLAVGGLRRPVATTSPLLGPTDWEGLKVVIVADSQRAPFADLGATTTVVHSSLAAELKSGASATELDMGTYHLNLLAQQAPYITANVVLWPKVWALVVNADRFAGLTAEQQGWVREAAASATAASVTGSHDEASLVQVECGSGARYASASASDVKALKEAFAPTLQRLAADPVDGPLLTEVEAVVAAHPGVDALTVPDGCSGAAPRPTQVGAIPKTKSDIPPGTYRMTLTKQDLIDAGVTPEAAEENDSVITLVLKADGTYTQTSDDVDPVSPDFTNLLWEVGTYRGTGSTVYFLPDVELQRRLKAQGVNAAIDRPASVVQETPYSVLWNFDGRELSFRDVQGIFDAIAVQWMVANPYTRIS